MTGRTSIAGVERAWASPDALGAVCPTCGARGLSHDRERCAGRRPPTNGHPALAAGDLSAVVLDVLREHGPISARGVLRVVPRRAIDVRAALRALEADGVARRGDDGWEATR
jgi:hypothetical protein